MHFLFVLIDSRLEPQKIDRNFLEMLGENGIPFGIIFTKIDKLSKIQIVKNVEKYQDSLRDLWEELPPMFISSSSKKRGREEILNFIGDCIEAHAKTV